MSRTAFAASLLAASCPVAVFAQSPSPTADTYPAESPDDSPDRGAIIVTGIATGRGLPVTANVTGQTATRIDAAAIRDTPATTVADLVKLSPGVAIIQGNGPRDVGVSLRGSNARNSFGARNIVVFEDDFPVTQPDGLARFDLADPHAYGALDVVRGPSSARYGNYAIGGAINFRTRTGAEVNGVEAGLDIGGYGYANLYTVFGQASDGYDYALFASFVTGDGATGHSGYETTTINARATYILSPRDRLTTKVIVNQGEFRLSTRLSMNQYLANPYQQGCAIISAAAKAAGCGFISVLVNGVSGTRVDQSAAEGDLARNDRRSIFGLRYEHDLDAVTTWRTQGVFDSRVVFQPTNATPFRGTLNSYALGSDMTRDGRLLGMDATSFATIFFNRLSNDSHSFNKTPSGRDGIGAPTQTVQGHVANMGLRLRQELALADALTLVAAVGAERSVIDMVQTAYAYPAAGPTLTVIPARRRFWNVAPEAALLWRASDRLRLHARFAGGYGIPQSGALFVTTAGVPGNNVAIKTQTNRGVDIGATLAIGSRLTAEISGYHEWFRNEQISQSAGVGLLAYTSNAPRSVHRGVEAGVTWRPLPGVSAQASYSHNDHRYTDFVERLTTGAVSRAFDRAGNRIPGVVPDFANARIGYDRPAGGLAGLGGFIEATWRSAYAIDNGNQLRIPGYVLANINIHYDPPAGHGWLSRVGLFASVQNLFDRTYIGSASVIADSVGAGGQENPASVLRGITGSIYAGAPRTVYAGIRSRF